MMEMSGLSENARHDRQTIPCLLEPFRIELMPFLGCEMSIYLPHDCASSLSTSWSGRFCPVTCRLPAGAMAPVLFSFICDRTHREKSAVHSYKCEHNLTDAQFKVS